MDEALFTLSIPENEPVLTYRPGSKEKHLLKNKLKELLSEQIEIPIIIGGKEIYTGDIAHCIIPHNHAHILASYHKAGIKEIKMAKDAAIDAWHEWSSTPWPERVSVFLKAAEMLSGPWRMTLNAATMLCQSKTVFQAEIDAACELIDFFRFNSHFVDRIYSEQPASTLGIWDRLEWRPLEGFIFAITPFNFTSIAGNLPTAPAMMGNTVVWKPSGTAVYSNYFVMKLLKEAGLPDGVINFVPGQGSIIGKEMVTFSDLAGIHFTGSTATFRHLWNAVGNRIERYRSYPRIVGETGGKDFIVAHASAKVEPLISNLVKGAFEYQGQKCSAVSRAYIPDNLWSKVKTGLLGTLSTLKTGDPQDFQTFMGAVIDEGAFNKITGYIDYAKESSDSEILIGSWYDKSKGYFIEPTVIVTTDPHCKLMEEEIFGPVLTIFVYPEKEYDKVLTLCDKTSSYALTGAVFAQDRYSIQTAHKKLRYAAGNFYVNDKPTGAVVGLQPFGGSRASGTNDKAGSILNLLRWVTPRTIKENFVPSGDVFYPHMEEG